MTPHFRGTDAPHAEDHATSPCAPQAPQPYPLVPFGAPQALGWTSRALSYLVEAPIGPFFQSRALPCPFIASRTFFRTPAIAPSFAHPPRPERASRTLQAAPRTPQAPRRARSYILLLCRALSCPPVPRRGPQHGMTRPLNNLPDPHVFTRHPARFCFFALLTPLVLFLFSFFFFFCPALFVSRCWV